MAEEVITTIVSGWRFQTIIFFLLGYNQLLLCFNNVVAALYHMTPDHHCQVLNDSLLNISIPISNEDEPASHPYDTCVTYVNPYNHSEGTRGCDKYIYYTTRNEHTIVKEWDLVCDKKYLPPLSSTLYFLGMTLGSLFFGHLADRFGRKPVILFCIYFQAAFGFALYFAQDIVSFLVIRTLLGIVVQGNSQSSLTLLMESSPAPNRGLVGVGSGVIWTVGILIFGILAFFIRQWRTIQLIIAFPALLSCIYTWFLPESVRWLLSTGKIGRAKKSVATICSWNGAAICSNIDELLEKNIKEIDTEKNRPKRYHYIHLFKTSEIRKRALILCYAGFSMAVCYFGILLNVTDLVGDRYLNFLIGAALELTVKIGVIMIVNKCKRKNLMIGTAVICASLCIAGVVVKRLVTNAGIVSTILILGSKASLTATFSATLLLQNELFPTVVRNMGNGACTFSMRIGGILAPQFIVIGQYTDTTVPFIIYGIGVFIAAWLTHYLPETRNAPLPDTIGEIENKPTLSEEEMEKMTKKS